MFDQIKSSQEVDTQDLPVGHRVGNSNYVVEKYLAGGSFGRIYLGRQFETNLMVAIKMEKKEAEKPQLHLEYRFYKELSPYRGIPKVLLFQPCGQWNALVMELLGPSLQKMLEKCEGRFTLRTVVQLTIQLLCLMEYVHNQGILYRDTKPENFLLGLPMTQKWYIVHLIDLGLCKHWRQEDGSHIVFQDGKCLTGTVRYMSIHNHLGHEQGRRDDLEAIGYMLIYLFKGTLPWQGVTAGTVAEKYYKIGEMKMTIEHDELCSEMPEEFSNYLTRVKEYNFEDEPNYRQIIMWFIQLLGKLGFEMDDKIYDWNRRHQVKPSHLRRNCWPISEI